MLPKSPFGLASYEELNTADMATINEAAQRWGFWHAGEFAADYRLLFGELPSQTLGSRSALLPATDSLSGGPPHDD